MVDPLYEATDAMVARGKRWRRVRDAWGAWVAFWRHRARELAVAAKVAASVTAIVGSIKAVLLMHARDVGRPEQQAGGSERMAVDRVDKLEPKR